MACLKTLIRSGINFDSHSLVFICCSWHDGLQISVTFGVSDLVLQWLHSYITDIHNFTVSSVTSEPKKFLLPVDFILVFPRAEYLDCCSLFCTHTHFHKLYWTLDMTITKSLMILSFYTLPHLLILILLQSAQSAVCYVLVFGWRARGLKWMRERECVCVCVCTLMHTYLLRTFTFVYMCIHLNINAF